MYASSDREGTARKVPENHQQNEQGGEIERDDHDQVIKWTAG